MIFRKKKYLLRKDITPDEIFLDAQNTLGYSRESFEGVIESAIKMKDIFIVSATFVILLIVLLSRLAYLQVNKGEELSKNAQENHLRIVALPVERGVIYDRYGLSLALNGTVNESEVRIYNTLSGLAHVLGYVGYLSEDDLQKGDYVGKIKYGRAGIEKEYDRFLKGEAGQRLIEVDSHGAVVSQSIQKESESGADIILTIDAKMQSELFKIIEKVVKERGFEAGAGVVMDTKSGEILSLVSWPEYDSNLLSSGTGSLEDSASLFSNPQKPFFFRAISGLYAPGSIVKPIVALGALEEGIVNEDQTIFSSGSISIPNPYNLKESSVFYDWKPHGFVNLKEALAQSSNVYFYTVGGGFEDLEGLGATRIKKYFNMFNLGKKTGIDIFGEVDGFVPSPEWKASMPEDKIWRVGDTYNLSIGQGWLQVTPLQMASVIATISRNGLVVTPHLVKEIIYPNGERIIFEEKKSEESSRNLERVDAKNWLVVKEGLRMAVRGGTAQALSGLGIDMGAKTGTAEIGKKFVNSWLISFAPYEDSRIAVSLVLEKGDVKNLVGAPYAARQFFEWMAKNRPEYFE